MFDSSITAELTPGCLKIRYVIFSNKAPILSQSPLSAKKDDNTINGNKEGMTVFTHRLIPETTPSPDCDGNLKSKKAIVNTTSEIVR
ncbi:MAG: hypothetical protein NC122_06085 [Faecalibacterium sp.]|nr:hypothetical protein [Ruminococcus sp.]MCM1391632.1 hypothetical protein [Ruminococcus sp.]MCM1485759.1 hypothetical protein [Faecalibacterium sp.]